MFATSHPLRKEAPDKTDTTAGMAACVLCKLEIDVCEVPATGCGIKRWACAGRLQTGTLTDT